MSNSKTVINIRKFIGDLAEQAGTIIEGSLMENHSVAKKEIVRTLAELNDCSATLAYGVVDSYLEARDDLESHRGPGGGVSRKGSIKPRFTTDNARMIISLVDDELKKMTYAENLKTRELTAHVSQRSGLPANECRGHIVKYLRTRDDIRLVKGPYGGILKAPKVAKAA